MKTVAVVPIKMNNVRTPGKNTKPFSDGTPLIKFILSALLKSKEIDEVYVYCSNEAIKHYMLDGVKYIKRDDCYDTPQADVIEMMKVFSHMVDADIYVQAHATTPFLTAESIDNAVAKVKSGENDSAFAVVKVQDFLWKDGFPINYSLEKIPRTQDMEPMWMETTGLYIYTKTVIDSLNRRIGNRPYLAEVNEIEALDIDTPLDFEIADAVYNYLKKEK